MPSKSRSTSNPPKSWFKGVISWDFSVISLPQCQCLPRFILNHFQIMVWLSKSLRPALCKCRRTLRTSATQGYPPAVKQLTTSVKGVNSVHARRIKSEVVHETTRSRLWFGRVFIWSHSRPWDDDDDIWLLNPVIGNERWNGVLWTEGKTTGRFR